MPQTGPNPHSPDLPDPQLALFHPDEFRAHPKVLLSGVHLPIMASLALPHASSRQVGTFTLDQRPPWNSWFGGRPLAPTSDPPSWPMGRNGYPLVHVLQVDLAAERNNQRAEVYDLTGLPSTGLLQLFHDLESYGRVEYGEELAGSWSLRVIESQSYNPAKLELQAPPRPYGGVFREFGPVLLNPVVAPTVPTYLDFPDGFPNGFPTEAEGRYVRVLEWLESFPDRCNSLREGGGGDVPSPWDDGFEPAAPVSRVGGFSAIEGSIDFERELETGLPLEPGDSHVLLIEVHSSEVGAPVNWFHGLRPLQVWIRASDLAMSKFDEVWCQIRTDA
jgi:uncharacterized protein YwqG